MKVSYKLPKTIFHIIKKKSFFIAQWDPLLNRTGQIGQTFVRDMSLLESQSKGCVNPTFDPAHKCIFAMYLQGRICRWAYGHVLTQYFETYVAVHLHFRRPC